MAPMGGGEGPRGGASGALGLGTLSRRARALDLRAGPGQNAATAAACFHRVAAQCPAWVPTLAQLLLFPTCRRRRNPTGAQPTSCHGPRPAVSAPQRHPLSKSVISRLSRPPGPLTWSSSFRGRSMNTHWAGNCRREEGKKSAYERRQVERKPRRRAFNGDVEPSR